MPTSDTGSIFLDNCRVPKENLLGPLGKGLGVAYSGLMSGRLSVAAGCLGVIDDCITEAVNYSKQRVQHGKPIGKHQLVQRHIGIMSTNLEAAKNLVYKAALLKQHSDEQPENKELREHADITIAQAKYFASNASFDAADRTVSCRAACPACSRADTASRHERPDTWLTLGSAESTKELTRS